VNRGLGSAVAGVLAVLAVASAGALPTDPGQVPLAGPGLGTHDPTIAEVEGRFVRVQTGRGVPLAVSADLRTWETAGSVFSENPAWIAEAVPGAGDLWAPDLVHRGDEWRLYYAVSTFGSQRSALGLAVNRHLDPTRPSEGWEDRGPVFRSFPGGPYNAIDPQAFADPAGGERLVFGSFWGGIFSLPLAADGTVVPGSRPVNLAFRPQGPHAVEGAFLWFHQGQYYLFTSWDFCCQGKRSTYHIRVGRGATALGPFFDRDGMALTEGGGTLVKTADERDLGPGHNSILVTGAGVEYLVYHVYDARYGGASRLRVQELSWDEAGWPR